MFFSPPTPHSPKGWGRTFPGGVRTGDVLKPRVLVAPPGGDPAGDLASPQQTAAQSSGLQPHPMDQRRPQEVDAQENAQRSLAPHHARPDSALPRALLLAPRDPAG